MARHRTKSTSAQDLRIGNRASSHGKTGHAVRLVPSHVRWLPASREIASVWKSSSLAAGGTCRSFHSGGQRNRLFDCSARSHGANVLRCRVPKTFYLLLIVKDRTVELGRTRNYGRFSSKTVFRVTSLPRNAWRKSRWIITLFHNRKSYSV